MWCGWCLFFAEVGGMLRWTTDPRSMQVGMINWRGMQSGLAKPMKTRNVTVKLGETQMGLANSGGMLNGTMKLIGTQRGA